MIEETVGYLVESGRRVVYDAEHFFDGYARGRRVRARDAHAAAARRRRGRRPLRHQRRHAAVGHRGARAGGACAGVAATVGIHAHDDAGCAVANSLAAVRARRDARAGDDQRLRRALRQREPLLDRADLELKLGRRCLPAGALAAAHAPRAAGRRDREPRARRARALRRPQRVRAQGRRPRRRHPPGRRAPYQHVDPALVGNETRVVVSELSGRGQRAREGRGVRRPARGGRRRPTVLERVKAREARGFAFEAAEASVALMLRREGAGLRPAVRAARLPGDRRPARRGAAPTRRRPSSSACAARSCTRRPRATAR